MTGGLNRWKVGGYKEQLPGPIMEKPKAYADGYRYASTVMMSSRNYPLMVLLIFGTSILPFHLFLILSSPWLFCLPSFEACHPLRSCWDSRRILLPLVRSTPDENLQDHIHSFKRALVTEAIDLVWRRQAEALTADGFI